jgi:hypothetical protein
MDELSIGEKMNTREYELEIKIKELKLEILKYKKELSEIRNIVSIPSVWIYTVPDTIADIYTYP